MTLTLSLRCLGPCGLLAEGRSTDPPATKRPTNWKGDYGDGAWDRWAELDHAAGKHSRKGGHPSVLTAVPGYLTTGDDGIQ